MEMKQQDTVFHIDQKDPRRRPAAHAPSVSRLEAVTQYRNMKLAAAFGLVLMLDGCTPRRHIVLPGTQFRIAAFEGDFLTLSPPVANAPVSRRFTLEFPVSTGPPSSQPCVETSDLFRIAVDRKERHLSLDMPSLHEWQALLPQCDQLGDPELDRKIDAILAAPETLESRGCLAAGSAIQLSQILRDSVPMRPGYDLYTAYGYRPGGLRR